MGSQLAVTPPEQRRGAVIDNSMKTSMRCLAVVQKASKMLGITKKGTGNKIKNPHDYGAALNFSTTF